jgi:molybdenum cofactor guanylyltransferase
MPPLERSQTPLFGLVLGGGKSRRMGTDKAVLQYHGRPQFAVAFDLLADFCAERFVSLRAEQAAEPSFAGFPHLLDAYPGEGPLAAVVSAQMQKPGVTWLVIACDLPFLDKGTLADLVAQRDAKRHATAYLSQHDGRIEPLCAIYEPSSAPLLAQAFTTGLRCARKGLESVSPLGLTLPKPNALENANTPSDRESFMSQLQSGSRHDEKVQAEPNPAQAEQRPVRVTLYAQLREALGREQVVSLRLPAAEGEVLTQLAKRFPAQASLIARCRIAVQDAYLLAGEQVPQVEEFDLIAPVSGG